MMEPCFNYFSIDVGDIWEYETRLFLDSGINEQLAQTALEKVRTMIIERARPSVLSLLLVIGFITKPKL